MRSWFMMVNFQSIGKHEREIRKPHDDADKIVRLEKKIIEI
jgi:hypothetical protein